MGLLETIYNNVPIFMQNIMVSTKGYCNHGERYGKAYYKHLAFLKKFDTYSLEEKLQYQQEELVNFLRYTIRNSKFYRELYKGIDIDSIRTVQDLKKLPIVDKEILRQNIDDIITVNPKDATEGHTGGTTGKSLVIICTKEDLMKRMATLDYFKSKVGFKHLTMRRATFNGKHIIPKDQTSKVFWRYNKACKQMIFSSFHITEENIPYYIEALNKFKPQALDGFFTCMCDIANYIDRKNIRLEFQPIAIFPTSETLTEDGRALLERVFKCKVYDQYASSEGAPFVVECKNQTLHMDLSSGVFEHFEKGSNEVLVTSFTTYGTPLIRYRIGDSMQFADKNYTCTCCNNQPIVKEIQGRRLDFIYTAEGAKINAGNISNLFKNMPNALIRAQVIQEKIGEVLILLEIDKEKYTSNYDTLLHEEFSNKFGLTTKLTIKHVDEIPREKSGKFRLIKNNVKEF